MADTRNLGTGSGGSGTARFSGGLSGTVTVGNGLFVPQLPNVYMANSPVTSRNVDCTATNNAILIHNKTVMVMIIAPPNNTVAIAVGESTDASTQLELNPNGFICWTMKAGSSRQLQVLCDGAVTLTVIEA